MCPLCLCDAGGAYLLRCRVFLLLPGLSWKHTEVCVLLSLVLPPKLNSAAQTVHFTRGTHACKGLVQGLAVLGHGIGLTARRGRQGARGRIYCPASGAADGAAARPRKGRWETAGREPDTPAGCRGRRGASKRREGPCCRGVPAPQPGSGPGRDQAAARSRLHLS